MWTEPDSKTFLLSVEERAVLTRAAAERRLAVDESRTSYVKAELIEYGMVREAFSEMELIGLAPSRPIITSRDADVKEVECSLGVGSPHQTQIGKWQLPVRLPTHRPVLISFPPGSRMKPKSQPINDLASPGGALRVVLTGSLACNDVCFQPGEWFFVTNGAPYELTSDEKITTTVLYLYDFPSSSKDGRFSFEADV